MKAYLAIKELQERLDIIESDFSDQPELQNYAEALRKGIEALRLLTEDQQVDADYEPVNEDIQDDHIDEDIQAADMAAEDMEDNTEEEW